MAACAALAMNLTPPPPMTVVWPAQGATARRIPCVRRVQGPYPVSTAPHRCASRRTAPQRNENGHRPDRGVAVLYRAP